jgi:hypothetical protein
MMIFDFGFLMGRPRCRSSGLVTIQVAGTPLDEFQSVAVPESVG